MVFVFFFFLGERGRDGDGGAVGFHWGEGGASLGCVGDWAGGVGGVDGDADGDADGDGDWDRDGDRDGDWDWDRDGDWEGVVALR